jgi:hypothetical protein
MSGNIKRGSVWLPAGDTTPISVVIGWQPDSVIVRGCPGAMGASPVQSLGIGTATDHGCQLEGPHTLGADSRDVWVAESAPGANYVVAQVSIDPLGFTLTPSYNALSADALILWEAID